MYGILAACIAVMAMFLGLFALSVEPQSQNLPGSQGYPAVFENTRASLDQNVPR